MNSVVTMSAIPDAQWIRDADLDIIIIAIHMTGYSVSGAKKQGVFQIL